MFPLQSENGAWVSRKILSPLSGELVRGNYSKNNNDSNYKNDLMFANREKVRPFEEESESEWPFHAFRYLKVQRLLEISPLWRRRRSCGEVEEERGAHPVFKIAYPRQLGDSSLLPNLMRKTQKSSLSQRIVQ